jgi:hypothetical protein
LPDLSYLIVRPSGFLSTLEHRPEDPVGGAVAIGEGLDVDDDLFAHREAALDRRRAHMRQEHDIVEGPEAWVDGRRVLEDVEAGAGDGAGFEQCHQRFLVDDFTARC